jgi:hypothetical protein
LNKKTLFKCFVELGGGSGLYALRPVMITVISLVCDGISFELPICTLLPAAKLVPRLFVNAFKYHFMTKLNSNLQLDHKLLLDNFSQKLQQAAKMRFRYLPMTHRNAKVIYIHMPFVC